MTLDVKEPRMYILIIGIILIILIMVIYPKKYGNEASAALAQAQDSLSYKEMMLASLQGGNLEDMALIEQRMDDYAQQLDELERFVPRSYNRDDFLAMLTEKAENSGLTIHTLVPNPSSRDGQYTVYPWTVAVSGQFHRLGVFFDQLTQQMLMTAITNISIEQVKSSEGSYQNMTASFSISAYVQSGSTGIIGEVTGAEGEEVIE